MSARTILKHLYEDGRMTEAQYQKIDRNLKARPHGEWVHTTVCNTEFINCKNCGCGCPLYSYVKKGEKEEKVQHYETDFCPNCGADMRGEDYE